MSKNDGILSKGLLMTMLITGAVIVNGGNVVFAAESETQSFTLDQMIVTATRYEKKDVDVPASTVILTAEDLKNTGATNLQVALSKVPGLAYKNFGPGGAAMGTMGTEINIRGVSNGTLVLVNGTPINLRGKYYLDSIPVENIERVEIVKGGGSVLYGSEAMGGVVNIILKKEASNSVTVGYGNLGQQKYNVNVGDDKLRVGYNLEKWGEVNGVSDGNVSLKNLAANTVTNTDDTQKNNISLGYSINDHLDFSYNYYETEARYDRFLTDILSTTTTAQPGDQYNSRKYTTRQHLTQLNYNADNFKANMYFNKNDIESYGPTYFDSKTGTSSYSIYNTKEENRAYGIDLQKNWKINDRTNTILGATYQDEYYDKSVYATGDDYERNNWAVYGQWDQALSDKNSMILSARETWTTGAKGDQNYSNFSAAGQFIHKLGEDNNIYASVGQSFIMPTFAQMYGASDTAIANPELKPQTGVNYEMGWKKMSGDHNWKTALYHIDITDNITAKWDSKKTEYQYINEDFKNTGIEVTCDIEGENGWSYNWGVNYGDPKSKSTGLKAVKPYWDRNFGRLQLTGGVNYNKDKWTSSLTGSYLADRVGTPSSSHSEEIKPYFLTTLSTTYHADKKQDITLTMDNVLDRNDNLSHTGGYYYSTPFNFLLSYTYKF